MITRRRHHNRTSRVQDSAYNDSALRFATERDDCTPRRVDFATGFRAVVSCRVSRFQTRCHSIIDKIIPARPVIFPSAQNVLRNAKSHGAKFGRQRRTSRTALLPTAGRVWGLTPCGEAMSKEQEGGYAKLQGQDWSKLITVLPCTLGRAAECDVVVEGQKISRKHAEIAWRGDHFVLNVLGKNGAVVDGTLPAPRHRWRLASHACDVRCGRLPAPGRCS